MTHPLLDVSNKVVVITGGAGGIGRALVEGFAEAGAIVFAADRAETALNEVAERLRNQGHDVHSVELDVVSERQVEQVLDTIVRAAGRVDVLINNAGIKSDQSILTGNHEAWERTLDVNARSVLTLSRLAIEKSMRVGGGSIINTGSSISSRAAVLNYQAGGADYCLSKAMVHSITQLLAYEAARFGVTVNAIAPGIVDTPIHERSAKETESRHVSKIPLDRIGLPTDLVGPALFLASAGSSYMTGQILHVNGGMMMEP